jgi:hypothetical protein
VQWPQPGVSVLREGACIQVAESPSLALVQEMTEEERELIKHLDKCDFTEIHRHFMDKAAARKALPREEKQVGCPSHSLRHPPPPPPRPRP